jgi:hypothetical protein
MTDPAAAAMAPCYVCGLTFWFDPARVPNVPIDPQTGLPPDLGGDPQRAIPRVLCPTCVKTKINPERRKRGLALFSEEDTVDAWRIAQELLAGG